MRQIFAYSFPLVVDLILGMALFIGPMRAVENNASVKTISLLITAYGFGYIIFSFLMGKIVKIHLAKLEIIFSGFYLAILCTILALNNNIYLSVFIYCIFPLGTSMFFNAFQAFMKNMDKNSNKPLTTSVSYYIFSWSIGFALGPFVSGWIREYLTWDNAYLCAAILSVMVSIAAIFILHQSDEKSTAKADTHFANKPDLALAGWASNLFGGMVLALFFTVYPKQSELFAMRPALKGMVIFTHSTVQAFFVLFLKKSKNWMYHPYLLPLSNVTAIIGLLLLFYASSPAWLFIAAVFLGLYSSYFFFCSIFHSLSHPSQSVRNIAVNEAAIGTGFLLGPQLVNLTFLADNMKFSYIYALVLVLLLIVFQHFVIKMKSR